MEFGLMFFSAAGETVSSDKYALLKEAARFGDRNGLSCIWTPERHFHPFGGLFPNPALTSAALATITERIGLRAGSLVSPLHDAIRIAEEWAVVDNLSGGRAAISFGSGWNVADFVFFPERYQTRQAFMYEQIEAVGRLWQGEPIKRRDSFGNDIEVCLFPRPVQTRLPVWVTSSGAVDTFIRAGSIGANLLTHLLGQDIGMLSEKIEAYRNARREAGFEPHAGTVTLMLHTLLGNDIEEVRRAVHTPFREYLRAAISLEQRAAAAGGTISGSKTLNPNAGGCDPELLDITFERYFHTAALMGTEETCREMVLRLEEIGVDEVACLIDFGVPENTVLSGLEQLASLAAASRRGSETPQSFPCDFAEANFR